MTRGILVNNLNENNHKLEISRKHVEFQSLDELDSLAEVIENLSEKLNRSEFVVIYSIKSNQKWNGFPGDLFDHFPGYQIQDVRQFLSKHEFTRRRFKHAYIIHNSEDLVNQSTQLILHHLITKSHEIILRDTYKWAVLGDEIGTPGSLQHGKFRYSWVIVPPQTKLEPLPLGFHCAREPMNVEKAVEQLEKHPEIEIICFEEQGVSKREKKSQLSGMAHLDYWEYTLPLIAENIIKKTDGDFTLTCFVEEAGSLKSGKINFRQVVDRLRTILQPKRADWKRLRLESAICVKKDEHPWHGYADAIGLFLFYPVFQKKYPEFKKRIKVVPYRRIALHESIHNLHGFSGEPLKFLKELLTMKSNDLRDYVEPFFSELVSEYTANLTVEEWTKLGKAIRNQNNEGCHEAVRIILESSDLVTIYEQLDIVGDSYSKFELCMTALGRANHQGNHSSAEGFIQVITDLIAEKKDLISDKRKSDFILLVNGREANIFNFQSALDYYENNQPVEFSNEPFDENNMKFWSDKMQLLAFIGKTEQALEISTNIEELYRGEKDEGHDSRHRLYTAELLVELDAFSEAREILAKFSEQDKSGSYFMAIWSKLIALDSNSEMEYLDLKTRVEFQYQHNWKKDHPSQRILYWAARAAQKNEDEDFAIQCGELLKELVQTHSKPRDAFGVILTCEMADLCQRGIISDFEPAKYYQEVFENSHEHTQEWMNSKQNHDDPLSLLSFNYN